MTMILDALNWRYATKVFDNTRKIAKEEIEEIIESFRLTASAYWLQTWKLLVVKNQWLKNALVEASWGQKQVADCSDLLVLCRLENIWDTEIDKHLDNVVKTRWVSRADLAWYENMMKWNIWSFTKEQKDSWASCQVYLALWNLLTVLALKKIDSCPMEGIMRYKYDEVLELKEKWLKTVLSLPIWYRSSEDKYASLKKVRFSMEEVVEEI